MTSLDPASVSFHPHSYADPGGRLFRYEGRLYRAVRGDEARLVASLLEAGTLGELAAAGLVETRRTSLELAGYDFVLEHPEIPFVTYPPEWPWSMLLAAANAYLNLLDALAKHGLTLKDVHPWNLVFDGLRPVFVDVTSLARGTHSAELREKFRRYYLLPLTLVAAGHGRVARALMPDYDGITPADAERLLGKRSLAARGRRRLRARRHDVTVALRTELAELRPPSCAPAVAGDDADAVEVAQSLGATSALLFDEPTTVASALAGASRVIAAYAEECRGELAYAAAARAGDHHAFQPGLLDFTRPTPRVGFAGHFALAAVDRLAVELVVVRAAVPFLRTRRRLRFEHIAAGAASFTTRFALVGLPDDDDEVPELEQALRDRFGTVRRDRLMFVCER
jgi:hypothetical protein